MAKEITIDYNDDLERVLKEHAEECESLSILHRSSYEKFNRLSTAINIPIVVLSSAIGFATGIDIGYDKMNIILGVGGVFIGIIKTVDSYFQLAKRAESHRMCSLQFMQISKKIQIELALTRDQRISAKDMLQLIKTDIKNLQDIAPLIDFDVVKSYNEKYSKYRKVKKPNFVNGLTEVKVNTANNRIEYESRHGSRQGSREGSTTETPIASPPRTPYTYDIVNRDNRGGNNGDGDGNGGGSDNGGDNGGGSGGGGGGDNGGGNGGVSRGGSRGGENDRGLDSNRSGYNEGHTNRRDGGSNYDSGAGISGNGSHKSSSHRTKGGVYNIEQEIADRGSNYTGGGRSIRSDLTEEYLKQALIHNLLKNSSALQNVVVHSPAVSVKNDNGSFITADVITSSAAAAGTRPQSAVGTRPSSAVGTRPQSAVGTRPSSAAGTRPPSVKPSSINGNHTPRIELEDIHSDDVVVVPSENDNNNGQEQPEQTMKENQTSFVIPNSVNSVDLERLREILTQDNTFEM